MAYQSHIYPDLLQGNIGWQGSTPGGSILQSPSTSEKSERKLMGSIPLGPGNRACRSPSEKEDTEIPTLVSIQRWKSAKERPRESISLVTQLSMDRLPALENQCITWPDHLVAVVYVPMVGNSTGGPPVLPLYRHTTLEDVIRGIDAIHNFMETTAACAFHIELVGQFVAPGIFPGPYPINSLRNRALSLCPTDLAIPVDADFVATPMLGLPGAGYRDPAVFEQLEAMAADKHVLILPSLELTNKWQDLTLARNVARDMVLAGKKMAQGALIEGVVAPYRAPGDNFIRDVSNTTRWASTSSPSLYEVAIDPYAEPSVLLSLATVPWFDERFVDYGGGATTWFAYLALSNFTFLVHPYGFVVHVPHTRSPPTSQYMEAQKRIRQTQMELMRQRIIAEMKEGSYAPAVRECPASGTMGQTELAPPLWDVYKPVEVPVALLEEQLLQEEGGGLAGVEGTVADALPTEGDTIESDTSSTGAAAAAAVREEGQTLAAQSEVQVNAQVQPENVAA